MPRSRILRPVGESSDSESSQASSGTSVVPGRVVGSPTGEMAHPMDVDDGSGDLPPTTTAGEGGEDTGATALAMPPGTRGRHRTAPQVYFPPQSCTVCSLDMVFDTRTSFTQHLKTHRLFWSKSGEYAPMRHFGGQHGQLRPSVVPRLQPCPLGLWCPVWYHRSGPWLRRVASQLTLVSCHPVTPRSQQL